ncbi:phosphoribosylformylglycinamidine cyclo-ligase [Nitrososphaera sp.]|uniref:phosphoribosylformylglycinamidine cyclo-ligase n=1 Tax=Nitrososphaera sp. TaxID=1971748 RepID=UPI002ED9CC4E
MTYRDVGIDVDKIRAAQKSIGDIISATHAFPKKGRVLSGFGHYAGLVRLGAQTIALHSDGVGTKVLVAQLMNKFDTVGIDCVAMNVNDIICVGARPIAFIDYVALKQPNEALIGEIARGLVEGARQSQMAIVGGETAVLPDVIAGEGENAFDLAGMVMGIVEKQVLGNSIKPGDVILGVESSGLHSNGYTLARKVLLSKYSVDENAEHLVQTVGEELLTPTRIYVRPVMDILKKVRVHGLANITGGSFTKLPRLNKNVRYALDDLPAITGIFKQIQVDGNIDIMEMYRTFNMGIGFCVIAPKAAADEIIRTFGKHEMRCLQIGTIEKGLGVVASLAGKKRPL